MLELLQFVLGLAFLVVGMLTFFIQIFGVFRFHYVLNRMHAAAMGDTLGIGLFLIGLIILTGFQFASLKIALIIVFLWCTSPVSSHLICRLECTINQSLEQNCTLSEEAAAYFAEEHRKSEQSVLPEEEDV